MTREFKLSKLQLKHWGPWEKKEKKAISICHAKWTSLTETYLSTRYLHHQKQKQKKEKKKKAKTSSVQNYQKYN